MPVDGQPDLVGRLLFHRVIGGDHPGDGTDPLVGLLRTAENASVDKVELVDRVMFLRVGVLNRPHQLDLGIRQDGPGSGGDILPLAHEAHVDLAFGLHADIGDPHPQDDRLAGGEDLPVRRIDDLDLGLDRVLDLSDAHRLRARRVAEHIVGHGVDLEARRAFRRHDHGLVDVLLGGRAGALAQGVELGGDGHLVDVEDDAIDSLDAQVVDRLHADDDILSVDDHRLVVGRLHDFGGRRLVFQDLQGTHRRGDRDVSVHVSGLGLEAERVAHPSGGHVDVELEGRGRVLAICLVDQLGRIRTQGPEEAHRVDACLAVGGHHVDHDAAALGDGGHGLAQVEAAGV